MFDIIPICALQDNYIWLIHPQGSTQAYVVDPGDATPVINALTEHNLTLNAILITHHHWDHTHGIDELLAHTAVPVYGPATETLAACTHPLSQGDLVQQGPLNFTVLDIPGHTKGHIAYYGHGLLFCGDTLFSAGCGRPFEGTPAQLYASLQKLAQLPKETKIYCAHEYTQANLNFAQTVEPNNLTLQNYLQQVQKLRQQHQPTLPSNLALELAINPFLRAHLPAIQQAVNAHDAADYTTPVEVFSALRHWKDHF